MIHCCSEHSKYDPAAGARVMGGPAPQPLCAILLEHDRAGDPLFATGTLGGEMFNTFFAKYDLRLALEHGSSNRAAAVSYATRRRLPRLARISSASPAISADTPKGRRAFTSTKKGTAAT
jgi:hypothetical protein